MVYPGGCMAPRVARRLPSSLSHADARARAIRSQASAPAKSADPPAAKTARAAGPRRLKRYSHHGGAGRVASVQRAVETRGSLLAWEEVQVRTEQPGTIAKLFVDLGDPVTAGMTLAEYDRREFQLAVEQAEADLAAREVAAARASHRGCRARRPCAA